MLWSDRKLETPQIAGYCCAVVCFGVDGEISEKWTGGEGAHQQADANVDIMPDLCDFNTKVL